MFQTTPTRTYCKRNSPLSYYNPISRTPWYWNHRSYLLLYTYQCYTYGLHLLWPSYTEKPYQTDIFESILPGLKTRLRLHIMTLVNMPLEMSNAPALLRLKMIFFMLKRHIKINFYQYSNLIWSNVLRFVYVSRSYASHSTLRVSFDTLIWKYPPDVIQCVISSYCSNYVYICL